jgi:two-component system phosphate regulon response regulator PhoB
MAQLVVLAEDEEDLGHVVKTKLEHAGFEVVWMQNGNDAWSAIRSLKPALAILDVDMPGKSGFDVLEHVKATPETRDIPVVMLTALGQDAYVGSAIRQGASDYIVKPFATADLLARVERLLAAARPSASA